MTLSNTNRLTGTVLAALACASFVGCTRAQDRAALNQPPVVDTARVTAPAPVTQPAPAVTQETASNTTIAADDTATAQEPNSADISAPAPSDSSAASATSSDSSAKATKHSKAKHKAKKHAHKKAADDAALAPAVSDPVVSNEDQTDIYDSDVASDHTVDTMDTTRDYDQTVSATTQPVMQYRETGLSPFAQEPNSRIPEQVGSGQITGEDKSTTVLEGPSLFQDPSALGRDLVQ